MDEIIKTRLADFTLAELDEWLRQNGLVGPAGKTGKHDYRSAQIFKWLGRGAATFAEMTDIPLNLRASLSERAVTGIPQIVGEARSERDGTVKYAMRTSGGGIVESVLMSYRHGYSVCVSSQAGCRMGCTFCATKPGSFTGSLSPGEMYGQVAAIAYNAAQDRIGHVVVMGVGEPFDNYDNTLKFVRLLHEHQGTSISFRKITISTCGILSGILRLAEEGLPVGLSVSLHAPNDALRSRLMPVNRSCSIDKLLEGCKIYTYKTKRRVTFEYALIDGVNDAPDDAYELLRKIRGMLCHVNIIPVNKTENSGHLGYLPSPRESVRRFVAILAEGGAQATVRRTLGTDIAAACGQLRNKAYETG